MQRFTSLLLLLVAGCGGTAQRSDESAAAAEAEQTSQTSEDGAKTMYQPGDYVLYQYSGSYTEHPVILEEVIDQVKGNRLWIRVTATRGDETRKWIQVVTDTPKNRANNVIDELYEIRDGEKLRLENKGHADIVRLYSWTLPPCQGGPKQATNRERSISIMEQDMACTCMEGTQECNDEPFTMSACQCPSFLWTNASAQLSRTTDGHILWNVEVVEHGRKAK